MPAVETLIGELRRKFKPRIPAALSELSKVVVKKGDATESVDNQTEIKGMFPLTYGQPLVDLETADASEEKVDKAVLKVGVVLSGGQAAGVHNVVTGLFDALKALNAESTLLGFKNGPIGVMKNDLIPLTSDFLDLYRNTGGFDMIGSGVDNIESEEQQLEALKAVTANDLNGLMIIGGDDSNTNAAVLAEFFKSKGSKCSVVGIPKTIYGDLQNELIEMSVGFDTAVKTFSAMISNLCRDAVSAANSWHFVALTERGTSHVTIDCALQTQANMALIGEEIQRKNPTLHEIIEQMVEMIVDRAKVGKNYGVVLIPEGVIGLIPSVRALLQDLTEMLKKGSPHLAAVEAMGEVSAKIAYVRTELEKTSVTSLQNFDVFPKDVQSQLLLQRDAHGNVQLIPTQQLFMQICEKKVAKRTDYVGKWLAQTHFYEFYGCYPSKFDAHYCYALGRVGALLVKKGLNGYMSRVYDLEKDVTLWKAGAVPLTMLMNMEVRRGCPKAVIRKCLVDVEKGKKFLYFEAHRSDWLVEDAYRYLGPIQFFGPTQVTDVPPFNVLLKKTGDVVWPLPKSVELTTQLSDQLLLEEATAEEQLFTAKKESDTLRIELQQAKASLTEATTDGDAAKQQLAEARSKFEDESKEMESLKSQLADVRTQAAADLESAITKAAAESESLKSSLVKAASDSGAIIEELREANAKLEQRLTEAKTHAAADHSAAADLSETYAPVLNPSRVVMQVGSCSVETELYTALWEGDYPRAQSILTVRPLEAGVPCKGRYPLHILLKSDQGWLGHAELSLEIFDELVDLCPDVLYEGTGLALRQTMWHNRNTSQPYPLHLIHRILQLWPEACDIPVVGERDMWTFWNDDCPRFIAANKHIYVLLKVMFEDARTRAKESRRIRLGTIAEALSSFPESVCKTINKFVT